MYRIEDDLLFDQRLGQRLRRFRELKGITPRQLADAIGGLTTEQHVHDYELGILPVPIAQLDRIARAVDAAPYSLIHDVPLANASDWHLFSDFQRLTGNERQRLRSLVMQIASGEAVID